MSSRCRWLASLLLLLAVASVPVACDDTSEVADAETDTGPDLVEEPNPLGFCRAPVPPRLTSGVRLEPAFEHAFPQDDDTTRIAQLVPSPFEPGQWYLVKHKGWIVRVDEDPAVTGHEIVLDLRDGRVSLDNDEAGILSLTFHPSGDRAVLAYQSPSTSGAYFDSVVSIFDVREDGTMDPDSEVELVRLPQPNFPHSVTQVLFGPDGYLYAAFGDGGTQASRVNAQDPTNLYGTMIRIDVDVPDDERGTPYSIPADNPFADGIDGAPEVFAYGLRNTFRFTFDRETGTIWGGDVGESRREEINRIEAGRNYGWPITEGIECFGADACDRTGLEPPVVDYGHDLGISVTGGFVYRGGDLPSLVGRYLYADYISGTVWSIDADAVAGQAEPRVELETGFWITTFAESRDGELYLVRWSQPEHFDKTGPGGIYRVVPDEATDQPDDFPRTLSATGCMSDEDITQPASGLRVYTPQTPLWSDGAGKLRYLSLPEDGTIEVDADGDLDFPENAVLVKHFLHDDTFHETRLYIHHPEVGWRGYTYKWRDDQSDADLLETGENVTLSNGLFWRYPSRAQCARCHTAAAGTTLGLEVSQLAGPLPGEERSQIQGWFDDGLFAPSVTRADLDAIESLVAVDDDEANLEQRARSYLHSNCSNCHRPGGPNQSELDLRASTPLEQAHLCNASPTNGTLGRPGSDGLRLLVPGEPERSILYLRMTHDGDYRMPPLGTHIVDAEAAEVVRSWIESMSGCE